MGEARSRPPVTPNFGEARSRPVGTHDFGEARSRPLGPQPLVTLDALDKGRSFFIDLD